MLCCRRRLQIHKIMAGLLDQHQLAGTDEALKMAEQMASYFCGRWCLTGLVGGSTGAGLLVNLHVGKCGSELDPARLLAGVRAGRRRRFRLAPRMLDMLSVMLSGA